MICNLLPYVHPDIPTYVWEDAVILQTRDNERAWWYLVAIDPENPHYANIDDRVKRTTREFWELTGPSIEILAVIPVSTLSGPLRYDIKDRFIAIYQHSPKLLRQYTVKHG